MTRTDEVTAEDLAEDVFDGDWGAANEAERTEAIALAHRYLDAIENGGTHRPPLRKPQPPSVYVIKRDDYAPEQDDGYVHHALGYVEDAVVARKLVRDMQADEPARVGNVANGYFMKKFFFERYQRYEP